MPARTTLYQNIPTFSLSLLSSALGRILMGVDGLSVTWDDSRQSCLVHARANSWSRAARLHASPSSVGVSLHSIQSRNAPRPWSAVGVMEDLGYFVRLHDHLTIHLLR